MNEFDKAVASRTIYAEARGEDRLTQLGVAWTLLNRYRSGKWFAGQTLAECCAMHVKGSQYGQFSCWNVNDPNFVQIFRVDENSPMLLQCHNLLESALAGSAEDDVTHGATHYCNLSECHPEWIDTATVTDTIGRLTFFKNVN